MKNSAVELESKKALGARNENIPQKINMKRTQLISKNLLSTHFDFRHLISMIFPDTQDTMIIIWIVMNPPHFIMFMVIFTGSTGGITE